MVETLDFLKTRRSVLARNLPVPGHATPHMRELPGITARVTDHSNTSP